MLQLGASIETLAERLPQKAYCLARLGRKGDVEAVMEEIGSFSNFLFMSEDELWRSVVLISFS